MARYSMVAEFPVKKAKKPRRQREHLTRAECLVLIDAAKAYRGAALNPTRRKNMESGINVMKAIVQAHEETVACEKQVPVDERP